LDYETAQINAREANLNIRVLATGLTFTAHLTALAGIRETHPHTVQIYSV